MSHKAAIAQSFMLSIDGLSDQRFTSFSGLSFKVEEVEETYTTSTGPNTRKYPGKTTYEDITLKRAFTSNMELWKWMQGIADETSAHTFEPKTGTISILDQADSPIRTYSIRGVFPKKITMSDLDAGKTEDITEELVLAIEHFEEKK